MDWFYTQMVQTHAYAAWFVAVVFAVRGLAALFDFEWRMDVRLLAVVSLAYGAIAVTGLSLWALMHHDPTRDAWFAVKLMALAVYGVCAHWAVGKGRFRAVGYVLSLLMLLCMFSVSMTRQAWPFWPLGGG